MHMKIYASIPHASPLQFYQLLQTTYPSYVATHEVLSDKVTASGTFWHWTAMPDLIGDQLNVIGTFKGTTQDFETAMLAFKDALEAQQMIYLLEYETPTVYGHASHYLEHPAYQAATVLRSAVIA